MQPSITAICLKKYYVYRRMTLPRVESNKRRRRAGVNLINLGMSVPKILLQEPSVTAISTIGL